MKRQKSAPPGPPNSMRFYDIREVASMLAVSDRTVRRWIKNKKLVAHAFGGVVRIAESDLKAFIGIHRDPASVSRSATYSAERS